MNASIKTTIGTDTTAMGIRDFDAAIKAGTITAPEVLTILDARIARRKANGKSLVAKVVEYRNELATAIAAATGAQPQLEAMPQYQAKSQALPAGALPSDPEKLADAVFSTIGASGAGALIGRLAQRVAGASAPASAA